MLTYISATISNNPYRGGIEIKSEAKVTSIGQATGLRIWRKESTGGFLGDWNEIYSKTISQVSDLNFSLFDILALSGKTYSYTIDIMNGNMTIESGQIDNIDCWFEGLFVGNDSAQYVAGSNFKVEATRNTSKAYVTTLASKYPYAVANANTNYSTGSASGLFLKVTDDGKKFITDDDHSYSTKVLDFLTDNTYKILKTHDGQAWYISVDENASSPYNDHYTGVNSVQFSWTEIGPLPAFGMVVD